MRKRTLLLLFLLGISAPKVMASHGMGGELTWTCLGTGEFVFQMKFYRDCNGITPSNTLNMVTNHSIGSITLNLIQQNDISPDGYYSNGISLCPNCASGGNPAIVGLVEEYIYESAPVALNGIPPSTGWYFRWGECCRSGALTNVTGGSGFANHAVMYPYQGQNTFPCFDSSPHFAELPSVIQCTNISMNYQHLTFDQEMDSISYSLTAPIDDAGNTLQFNPGFTVANPLPGVLSMNSYNGQMSYTPSAGGYYVLAVKVSAYKCGILVSDTYREINVVLNNNCPPVQDQSLVSIDNGPPVISAPFTDPITGLYTSFADTVFVGDTVSFTGLFSDTDLFMNNSSQMVTLNSFGVQYGAGYTNAASGCFLPPCAILSNPPPYQVSAIGTEQFYWETAPVHLGLSLACVNMANTYHFIWKASDNYCPANASNSQVVSITVMPTVPKPTLINNGGTFQCSLTGNYTYQWYFNRFAIPGETGVTHTPQQSGTYHVLAVAPNGDGNYSESFSYNPLGINEASPLYNLSVFPNPSENGIFTITTSQAQGRVSYKVCDLSGRIIRTGEIQSGSTGLSYELDISETTKGVYLLCLTDKDGTRRDLKLVTF
jgi:Secretion system C-terminal sorting domain/PKD domain